MLKKTSKLVIFLTVFIDLIGFGIVVPLLPRYSETYGAQGFTIGAITAAYSVMQLLLAAWWGRLSDKIGRRPVILIGNAGSVLSYLLFAFSAKEGLSPNVALGILLVSRLFGGACGATIGVASAYIADITPPEKRSKGMALIGVAFGLGFILGPFLGGTTAHHFGLAGPGWMAAGLCLFNLILAIFILGESRTPDSTPKKYLSKWDELLQTCRRPSIGLLVGIYFIATFCFTCYEVIIPLLLAKKFGYDLHQIGYLFAYGGLVSVLVQGGVIGRLVKALGEPKLIAGSLIIVAASLILTPYVGTLMGIMSTLTLFSLASALNRAPTMGLISIRSTAEDQGMVLGVAQSAGTLARIVAPPFATTLYALHVPAPYLASAALGIVTALVTYSRLSRKPGPQGS